MGDGIFNAASSSSSAAAAAAADPDTLAEAAGGLGKDWSRTKYSEIDLVPARSAGPAT